MKYSSIFKSLILLAALAVLGGCASGTQSEQISESAHSIHYVGGASASSTAIQVHETRDRIYVSGSVRKKTWSRTSVNSRLVVQLVGADGKILAEEQDNISLSSHPRTARGGTRRARFVVSFPMPIAKQASEIRVLYGKVSEPRP